MIPGGNLLNMAMSVIGKQTVQLYRFASRETNGIGLDVTTYQDPVAVQGSFQPVPRRLYEQYGLDLQKNYATFYASADILGIDRDISGDYLTFAGKKWQCESPNDWFPVDGWKGILLVEFEGVPDAG